MPDTESGFFEAHPELYDALIDWHKRLANEAPFYRELFSHLGAQSVLDAACGTGQHAGMFHSWGLEVEGSDASPAMIEHCRRRLGESPKMRWIVRSFLEPAGPGDRRFDVVVCVGNSLALAGELDVCRRAVAAMLSWVRPGGAAVFQALNLWRLAEGPIAWQTPRRIVFENEPHTLLRGLHRTGWRGYVEFLDFRPAPDSSAVRTGHATFLGLEPEVLIEAARGAGGTSFEVFGSFGREAYERERSQDLILICKR